MSQSFTADGRHGLRVHRTMICDENSFTSLSAMQNNRTVSIAVLLSLKSIGLCFL